MTTKSLPLPRNVNGARLQAIEMTNEIDTALDAARNVMHNDPRQAEIHLLWAQNRAMKIRELLKDMPVEAAKGNEQ